MKKNLIPYIILSIILLTGSQNSSFAETNSLKIFTPSTVTGKASITSNMSEEILKNYLNQVSLKTTSKNADYSIKSKKLKKDGSIVFKIQQNFNNIPIFGYTQNILINNDGSLKAISGKDVQVFTLYPHISKNIISSKNAKNIAIKDLNINSISDVTSTITKTYYVKQNVGYLCYLVNLSFIDPLPGHWFYFIDAFTGQIIKKYNHLNSIVGINALNTGIGVLGDNKTLNVIKSSTNKFYLEDLTRGKGIFTYNANGSSRIPGTLFSNSMANWSTSIQKAGVDAHYYAMITYDFYKKTFDRNSFDDNGGPIKSTVHYMKGYNNAFWSGTQMVYGDGDGKMFLPLSGALDVVGHELTHAFTESEVGLIYQDESGAINESLSDIFGTLIEFYNGLNADWLMGEDIYTPTIKGDALRSLANPTISNDPDHYSKRYLGTEDNGGVHKNSGIINKAAFLISEGGTNNGFSILGIGRNKLAAILYSSICDYLTPTSDFSHFKACAVQAAADLYGKSSTEVISVNKAFDSVGIK